MERGSRHPQAEARRAEIMTHPFYSYCHYYHPSAFGCLSLYFTAPRSKLLWVHLRLWRWRLWTRSQSCTLAKNCQACRLRFQRRDILVHDWLQKKLKTRTSTDDTVPTIILELSMRNIWKEIGFNEPVVQNQQAIGPSEIIGFLP